MHLGSLPVPISYLLYTCEMRAIRHNNGDFADGAALMDTEKEPVLSTN